MSLLKRHMATNPYRPPLPGSALLTDGTTSVAADRLSATGRCCGNEPFVRNHRKILTPHLMYKCLFPKMYPATQEPSAASPVGETRTRARFRFRVTCLFPFW